MNEQDDAETGFQDHQLARLFEFFNEIGIINQLASTLFQKRLTDGVTVAQFSVLNHLIRVQDGQTPLALANAFQVPKTTMTHTLAGLQSRGLIDMRPNLEDGRSKNVWLTSEGRVFRDKSIEALFDDMKRLSPQLKVDRMAEAISLLSDVRKVLDDNRD